MTTRIVLSLQYTAHDIPKMTSLHSRLIRGIRGPRTNFEIGGGGTIRDSIWGGGHKTRFFTNSL